MTFSLPNDAEEVRELGYPCVPITQGHVRYLPYDDGNDKKRIEFLYIFEDNVAYALNKVEGLWACWPVYEPEYIVFEQEESALIFRMHYNP